MNCTGTSSKPRLLPAKANRALTGNDKFKANWMKAAKKLQADMDGDHKTFPAIEDQGQWHYEEYDKGCQQRNGASLQAS